MAETICRLYDKDDNNNGVVLWDFNDLDLFGTRLHGNPRIGRPERHTEKLGSFAVPGAPPVATQKGNRIVRVFFHLEAPTTDVMLTRMDTLNAVLDRGAWFRYTPNGGTAESIRIYRTIPSEHTELWDGRDYVLQLVEYAHSISYLVCEFECLPVSTRGGPEERVVLTQETL